MPRNGSGSYSLPQPPFTPGTVISSSAVNSDLSDIASALTQSVSSDGQTTITGQLKSNVTATPAYSALTDATTGFGVSTAGEADIFVSGTKLVQVTNTGATVNGNQTITGNQTVDGNLSVSGSQTFSGTAGIQIPAGTTTQRPASPAAGDIRFNSSLAIYEGYDGTEWQAMSQFDTAFTLTATVGSNLLTITVTNATTAAAPSASDPLAFTFRDATIANGDPTVVLATSALSISTNATGATLGTQSGGVPFRFWILVFNNGGTPVLALWHSGAGASTPAINGLNEGNVASTTGISAAATSAGVFYTPNGTSLTSKAYRIIGYLEYQSGLTTAGTYASAPTLVAIFTHGMKKPGDYVQTFFNTSSSAGSANSSTKVVQAPTQAISPTSACNLIHVQVLAAGIVGNNSSAGTVFLSRGSGSFTALTTAGQANFDIGNISLVASTSLEGFDLPGTTSSTTYAPWLNAVIGTVNWNSATGTPISTIKVTEIMA